MEMVRPGLKKVVRENPSPPKAIEAEQVSQKKAIDSDLVSQKKATAAGQLLRTQAQESPSSTAAFPAKIACFSSSVSGIRSIRPM